MTSKEIKGNTSESVSCMACGGSMTYQPLANALACDYCGSVQPIKREQNELNEYDFISFAQSYLKENFAVSKVITCRNCKAQFITSEILKSMTCPYCTSLLVEKNIHEERYIPVEYIAPFDIEKEQAIEIFNHWIQGLSDVPKKLKRGRFITHKITGVYIPFWTYDMHASAHFTGERGTVYYKTVGSGDNKREVRSISWTNVEGNVSDSYDDILIPATKTLNISLLSFLSHTWDLKALQHIKPDYLTGFTTEKYQVNLQEAFSEAKSLVEEDQRKLAGYSIGGSEQRVYHLNTTVSDITFKHILLPLYVSYYTYKNKHYSFYINGVNGKIVGQYPLSKWRLVVTHILAIIILALIILFIAYVISVMNAK